MSRIARAFPPSEKQSSLSSVSIGKVGTAPSGGQTSLLFPRRFAEITEIRNVKDSEGFSSKRETVLAFIRVYREGRHGSERWANLAAFSEATDLFRFRTIPDLKITTDHFILCNEERFNIISVEDVKGRGMYTEVLAKKVVATSG